MSRDLPEYPNLDYLKKQAKKLLRELRLGKPDSKLADALHTVARDYGFASWPKLRAQVESLPHSAEPSGAAIATSEGSDVTDSGTNNQQNESPFVGNWTANLTKTKRHPGREFQSATLQFAVIGETVTITDVVVDGIGQEQHVNTLLTDGREHQSADNPRYSVVARWLGPRVLEAVAQKDGRVEGRVIYEVSEDCKTLTLTTRAGAEGDIEQIGVFDRT